MHPPVSTAPLASICFDAFGTVFDLAPLLDEIDATIGPGGSEAFTARLVPWTWHATAADRYRPLPQIALAALRGAAREHGVRVDRTTEQRLVSRLQQLPPVPGAREVLRTLQPAQLALLSNGTAEGVTALATNAGVADCFLHLLSADQVRRFKPAPQVYALVPVAFGVSSDRVLMVSSNEWDVAGAHEAGLRTAWVSMGRRETRVLDVGADVVVDSLAALPDALADRGLIDFEPAGATIPGHPLPPGSAYTGHDKVSADSFPASDPPAY
jgi:2-haloacid dehalogenase